MKGIGIKRSNGIELVDATIEKGSIISSLCPADLGISCSVCFYAWTVGTVTVTKKGRKEMPFPFIVCHWYEAGPAERIPSPGTCS
jgi:hypothetical protein